MEDRTHDVTGICVFRCPERRRLTANHREMWGQVFVVILSAKGILGMKTRLGATFQADEFRAPKTRTKT